MKGKPEVYEIKGKEYKSLQTVADEFNIPYHKLRYRIKTLGNSIITALSDLGIDIMELLDDAKKEDTNISENEITNTEDMIEGIKGFLNGDEISNVSEVIKEEPTTSITVDKEYFIENIDDSLKDDTSKEINLIDYDKAYKNDLSKYMSNNTNVFFYDPTKRSNSYYTHIKGSNSCNVKALLYDAEHVTTENLMLFYLGYLAIKYPRKYNIISTNTKLNYFESVVDNYQDIENIINGIIKSNKNKINLIDFESVNTIDLLEGYLNDKDVLNIFLYNACLHSNRYYQTIYGKDNCMNIFVTHSDDQLIDHLIMLYLGTFIANAPDKLYNIVSHDNGYNRVVNILSQKYSITKNKDLLKKKPKSNNSKKEPDIRFKYSICKYILGNKKITCVDGYNRFDIKKLFYNFYKNAGKKIDENELTSIINYMLNVGVLESSGVYRKQEFYYFDLVKINNIVKECEKEG